MVKVKICGLKRSEDIKYVNALKPDYAGFVFAKSKRQVTLSEAGELIANLNKGIKKVGVFVDEDIEKVKDASFALKLDIIQLHGNEPNEYIKKLNGYEVWKAVSIKSHEGIKRLKQYNADAILLDQGGGGTGISFDWDIIKGISVNTPIILAGGLNSQNVEDAIKTVKPYAVDVSSGVETDGFKDCSKIYDFIKKARSLY
ncbi:N-(5'-phosphoribosyl)anthranilate isomerase [Oxobacter pfennigii]|uniref:N-(5'-phosphoribosyl)anthranilate isomerase n=1 Tax=Oxobacter pfennigii TaxID=36849 RepID=A0A0P8WYU6_9CLOT|nr:phosphoribosylanthranilate isomerase [Oxobacter pfennigii]KPU43597.1 N-(5'-phosphoribosyl)anthranilate isomerase [Oxobacter pfennigii]